MKMSRPPKESSLPEWCSLQRGADFGEFLLGFLLRDEFVQHRARAALIALEHQVARGFGHQDQEKQKKAGGNGAGEKHVAPADGIEPGIAAAGLGDSEVDEVNDQHAEDDGELVPGDQISTNLGRRDLCDIHRRQHGSQPDPNAAQDAIEDEVRHVPGAAVANRSKWKLRCGCAQSGDEEEEGGNDQSALAPDVGADPPANQPADNAADQGARHHKAKQRVRSVGLGGVA